MMQKIMKLAVVAACMLLVFSACKESNNSGETPDPEDKQFLTWVTTGNPEGDYLLASTSLLDGKVTPLGAGIDATSLGIYAFSTTDKDGYIYTLVDHKFTKSQIEGNQLKTLGSLVISDINYLDCYYFWDGDNLLLFQNVSTANSKPIYVIIDTQKLEITASGTVDIPVWPTDKVTDSNGKEVPVRIEIRIVELRDGKLLVGWAYNSETGDLKTHTANFDYPAMNNPKDVSDNDYKLWSNMSGGAQYDHVSFTDEEGDYYVGNQRTDKPGFYGFVRIKKGQTAVDPTYKFDFDNDRLIVKTIPVGNGKAIAQFYNDDASGSGYSITTQYIDLRNKTIIADLNQLGLPSSIYYAIKPVTIDEGKAYIAVASADQGNFVWEYDPSSNKLAKGLEIEGGVTEIPYLTRLK